MVGSLTASQITTAVDAIRRLQDFDCLTENQKAALQAVAGWLGGHRSLPGDLPDATHHHHGARLGGGGSSSGNGGGGGRGGKGSAEEDEATQEMVAAFTSSARLSGADRDNVLRRHSRIGQRPSMSSLERSSDSGGSGNGMTLVANPAVAEQLSKLHAWDFDVFALSAATRGRPLALVASAALHQLGLVEELGLPVDRLGGFLAAVEGAYRAANPYHNATHAADVVQTVFAIVMMDKLKEVLSPLELLALVIAAVVHDMGHQGVSNDFLVKTSSEWAITYNDLSPNENYHAAAAWRTLQQHNFLEGLGRESVAFVRALLVELIIGTDMKFHNPLLSDLKHDVGLFGADMAQWGATARAHALAAILHCADISNSVKPLGLSTEWARRVNAEFWLQGDQEAALGLPLNPLNDRAAANVPRSQKLFLELFGRPAYEALARIAPATGAAAAAHCAANLAHWEVLVRDGVTTL